MSKATNFILFVFGASIGSVMTWAYIKKKYERITQEEIDSVKEVFSRKQNRVVNVESDNSYPTEESVYDEMNTFGNIDYYGEDKLDFDELVKNEGYNASTKVENRRNERPKVISPDEFGENEDYEKISLKYYSDGILTDENDEIIEEIDKTVGLEALSHFGEYEDDSVFVRNDVRKTYYEILLILDRYEDIV